MNRVWEARSLRVWSSVTGESKLQEIKQQATGHIICMLRIDPQLFKIARLAFMQSRIQTQETGAAPPYGVCPLSYHSQGDPSQAWPEADLYTVKLRIVIATVLKDRLQRISSHKWGRIGSLVYLWFSFLQTQFLCCEVHIWLKGYSILCVDFRCLRSMSQNIFGPT